MFVRCASKRDLSKFIASGRLACTIDKVSGVITTNKLASQNKTNVYEQVVKQGDILLSGRSCFLVSRRLVLTLFSRHTKATPCCWIEKSRVTRRLDDAMQRVKRHLFRRNHSLCLGDLALKRTTSPCTLSTTTIFYTATLYISYSIKHDH
jgi:AraC-like DNA-binding protein